MARYLLPVLTKYTGGVKDVLKIPKRWGQENFLLKAWGGGTTRKGASVFSTILSARIRLTSNFV